MDYDYSELIAAAQQTNQAPNAFSIIIACIFGIMGLVGLWKIFTKAGEKGWKALIPIYNAYILFKISGKKFLKYVILTIIFTICYILMMVGSVGIMLGSLSAVAGGSTDAVGSMGILTLISSIGVIVTGIWMIVIIAKVCAGLSRAFGHGNGFAAGLFFLAPIFYLILGFNGDEYKGPAVQ
ncbi:MAG: hypothetical protein IKI57_06580 [Clostridia bacterium]|nr:hypothetical protein [Clostridia bacterium]